MTNKMPPMSHAADLVREHLPVYLGDRFEISDVTAESFTHRDRELGYIIVQLKPGHPPVDARVLSQFDVDMHQKFIERGFFPPPAVELSAAETGENKTG